jgi:aspartyl-tRNA(Asn)/glutamyl-tRNA(Gln) amidotransferase subunit A
VDSEVQNLVDAAVRVIEKSGAVVEEVSLPHVTASVDPSTQIALAEARVVHEKAGWFPARSDEYGEETRKRLVAGAEIRAADYIKALEFRKVVRGDFEAAFERVDAIVAPTTPIAAPKIGDARVTTGAPEDVRMALLRMNRPSNLTGLPAISVPCGFTSSGLPIGLQLMGRACEEARLLQIAYAYEQATPWHTRRPRF